MFCYFHGSQPALPRVGVLVQHVHNLYLQEIVGDFSHFNLLLTVRCDRRRRFLCCFKLHWFGLNSESVGQGWDVEAFLYSAAGFSIQVDDSRTNSPFLLEGRPSPIQKIEMVSPNGPFGLLYITSLTMCTEYSACTVCLGSSM